MTSIGPDTDAVREQLERLLGSPEFARNARISQFLRFIVERHLDGKDEEIKESVIAVEVFGRPADYNPKLDSIVRTEAARLRGRLAEYYAAAGATDRIVIEPRRHWLTRFSSGCGGCRKNSARPSRSRTMLASFASRQVQDRLLRGDE